jgi:threonine synthase
VIVDPQEYPYGPELVPSTAERAEGIWHWRRLLPLDGSDVYPLQIGGTPLVVSPGLRRRLGVPGLMLKDETRTPTSSNKDRATALCLVDAVRHGATSIASASSGNVACSLAAFVHGCEELVRCGVADRLPRVVGVQATGAAPLVQASTEGRDSWTAVRTQTIADGIDVGDPYFGRQALDAVARTGGSWRAVSDDDLRSAIATLARTAGILAEPAGAAALAGVIADREKLGAPDQTVVALVSGTGLKDQRWLPSDGGRAVPIAPSLDAVERALSAP